MPLGKSLGFRMQRVAKVQVGKTRLAGKQRIDENLCQEKCTGQARNKIVLGSFSCRDSRSTDRIGKCLFILGVPSHSCVCIVIMFLLLYQAS